jgi:hypothetical protein
LQGIFSVFPPDTACSRQFFGAFAGALKARPN